MAALGQLIKFLLIFPIACFCTYTVLLSLVRTIIRKGPRAAFSKTARNQPPKCMQDPTLGTHCYIYLEEVRLHYVTTGSEGKPLMVLVHGFPEFWYSWRYQLREFKDSFRVVAIDLRGYGDSDKPTDVSSYDVSKLVDDVKQLISALGYKKCVLVGHDWGGAVSWSFAQTYPDMVDKLIVMSCPSISAYMKNAWSRLGLRQLRRSWYFFFYQVPFLPELTMQICDYNFFDNVFLDEEAGVRSDKTTPEDIEAYKYMFARGGFTSPVNCYRQLVRSPYFMQLREGDLKMVTAPTLIVWGDQDSALETALATLSSEASVQGGATVKIIEGASHWVQMDRPDLVNKYMREFLSRK